MQARQTRWADPTSVTKRVQVPSSPSLPGNFKTGPPFNDHSYPSDVALKAQDLG